MQANIIPRKRAPGMDDSRSPFPLRLWHWKTARVLYTATIYVLICYLFRAAHETLILFLFAILFAYFLAPVVRRLEKPLHGRAVAILAVYVFLAGMITILVFVAGPAVVQETRDLAAKLPELMSRAASGQLLLSFAEKHNWPSQRIYAVQDFLSNHSDAITAYGTTLARKLATPITHLWWLLLIPILAIFFLKQGEEIAAGIGSLASDQDDRILISSLFQDVNVMLGSYIRSQMILAVLTLIAYTVVLEFMHVPYAMILGPLAGFLEFIPVVGPAIAAVSVLLIALLAGYGHMLLLVLFVAAWRIMQDYVNAPRIMGKSLEIDPLMQIFAVLAGGEIGGVVGALVSVPVVAIVRIVWRRMHENTQMEITPSGEAHSGPATGAA